MRGGANSESSGAAGHPLRGRAGRPADPRRCSLRQSRSRIQRTAAVEFVKSCPEKHESCSASASTARRGPDGWPTMRMRSSAGPWRVDCAALLPSSTGTRVTGGNATPRRHLARLVFSDEKLGAAAGRSGRFAAMQHELARWDDIDVHYGGTVVTSGGHGFSAMGRKALLGILQRRCAHLRIPVRFCQPAPELSVLQAENDLVIAADGANSAVRAQLGHAFGATTEIGHSATCGWCTDMVFEALPSTNRTGPRTAWSNCTAPYSAPRRTVIVEMHERVWPAGRSPHRRHRPGARRERRRLDHRLAELFADHARRRHPVRQPSAGGLPDDHHRPLAHGNVVLLGDAATRPLLHGSGTKLAMEGRARAGRNLSEHRRGRGPGGTRPSAARSWSPPSAPRRAVGRVRGHTGTTWTSIRPSSPSTSSPQPPDHPRHLRLRDPSCRPPHRALVRRSAEPAQDGAPRRCSSRSAG